MLGNSVVSRQEDNITVGALDPLGLQVPSRNDNDAIDREIEALDDKVGQEAFESLICLIRQYVGLSSAWQSLDRDNQENKLGKLLSIILRILSEHSKAVSEEDYVMIAGFLNQYGNHNHLVEPILGAARTYQNASQLLIHLMRVSSKILPNTYSSNQEQVWSDIDHWFLQHAYCVERLIVFYKQNLFLKNDVTLRQVLQAFNQNPALIKAVRNHQSLKYVIEIGASKCVQWPDGLRDQPADRLHLLQLSHQCGVLSNLHWKRLYLFKKIIHSGIKPEQMPEISSTSAELDQVSIMLIRHSITDFTITDAWSKFFNSVLQLDLDVQEALLLMNDECMRSMDLDHWSQLFQNSEECSVLIPGVEFAGYLKARSNLKALQQALSNLEKAEKLNLDFIEARRSMKEAVFPQSKQVSTPEMQDVAQKFQPHGSFARNTPTRQALRAHVDDFQQQLQMTVNYTLEEYRSLRDYLQSTPSAYNNLEKNTSIQAFMAAADPFIAYCESSKQFLSVDELITGYFEAYQEEARVYDLIFKNWASEYCDSPCDAASAASESEPQREPADGDDTEQFRDAQSDAPLASHLMASTADVAPVPRSDRMRLSYRIAGWLIFTGVLIAIGTLILHDPSQYLPVGMPEWVGGVLELSAILIGGIIVMKLFQIMCSSRGNDPEALSKSSISSQNLLLQSISPSGESASVPRNLLREFDKTVTPS
mgnify:CR=1 FL=1